MKRGVHQAGLTLIEVLVTLALLGLILQAIFSLQASTIQASTRLQGDADHLQALRTVNDYFTSRLRGASDVKTAVTVDGTECTLSSTTSPCFAIKVTETPDPTLASSVGYFMTYRLVPRSYIRPSDVETPTDPLAKDLRSDNWASDADNGVYVLVEKRWTLASDHQDDMLPDSWTSSDARFVSGGSSASVLADDLDPVDTSVTPAAFKFMTYAASRRFDVFLRVKRKEGQRVIFTPTDQSFMTSTFYRRN